MCISNFKARPEPKKESSKILKLFDFSAMLDSATSTYVYRCLVVSIDSYFSTAKETKDLWLVVNAKT